MRLVDRRLGDAVLVCALLAALPACVHRPLGEKDDGGPIGSGAAGQAGATGQGGQTGTGCVSGGPGLELVGSPLTVLDQPPTNGNLYTSLLWTGEEYLFIWRLIGGDSVLMQRIDASGQAVGGNIRVRDFEPALDVAWGGQRLAAVWSRKSGTDGRIMFQTFDGLGRPLIDETTLRWSQGIEIDGSVEYGPRIAALADRFAIVWTEQTNQILVATVGIDGHLLQGPVLAAGDLSSFPQLGLAASDARFVVGWNGKPPATSPPGPPLPNANVMGARTFSIDLKPLGDANPMDTLAWGGWLQVLAAGSGFLALWTHNPMDGGNIPLQDADVRIDQLYASGATSASGHMDAPASGPVPDLVPAAWNGDHLAVLWHPWPSTETGFTLSRFAPSGERQGASIDLPTAGPAGRFYITAHGGTLAFIWSEEIARGYEVYFQQARSCP